MQTSMNTSAIAAPRPARLSARLPRCMLMLFAGLLSLSSAAFAAGEVIGEIRMFGGNFAPRGWFLCDGQLLPISQYDALFSILGTTYGGDGRTTFALPDLRGRVAIGPRSGPGLPTYRRGQKFGSESVTLTTLNLPNHGHSAGVTLQGTEEGGQTDEPQNALLAMTETPVYFPGPGDVNFDGGATAAAHGSLGTTGAGKNYQRMPPTLYVNYIIAGIGVYPSRE